MNTKISTDYGEFSELELEKLNDGIKEIDRILSIIELQKESMKEIFDNLYDELKIPKKILRRIAKTYHARNYSEVVNNDQEFMALYEGIVKVSENN